MISQEQIGPRGLFKDALVGDGRVLRFSRDSDGGYFCPLDQFGKFRISDGMCTVDLDPRWTDTTHVKVNCSDKDPDPRRRGRIKTACIFKPGEPREKIQYAFGPATKVD